MAVSKWKYFSVRNPVLLDGKKLVSSVCYPIDRAKLGALEELAGKGKITLYEERMRFVSGMARPVPKPYVVEAAGPGEFSQPE